MSTVRPLRGRWVSVIAVAVACLLVPFGTVAAHADWQDSPVAKYVALGDSYAAGQGAGGYLNDCLVSSNGYPAVLDAVTSTKISLLRDPSCSGATTGDVIANQLSSLNKGTTLVTITAGANDVGLAALLAACAGGLTPTCQGAIQNALAALPQVGSSVGTLIADVHQRAPRATIVVTGYVLPFSSDYPDTSLAAAVNYGVGLLDQQIAVAVAAQALAGMPVAYASVSFSGHQIGDADSWLNGDLSDPSTFMHPTAAGYEAYADAILTALN